MTEYSRKELEVMTIPRIKDIMRENDVKPLTGKKADLIDRLLDAWEKRDTFDGSDEDVDTPTSSSPSTKTEYSEEELKAMKIPEIRDIMRSKGVGPLTGTKANLIERLMEAINGEHFVSTKLPVSTFGEHLTKAQRRQVLKKPAGTDYKLRKMREEIDTLANSGNRDDLNLAIEKVQGYTGFDKSRLIAFVMQKNFEMENSVEDCLAVLNEIVHYEDRLSYNELYDYLMPFLMGIFHTYDVEKDNRFTATGEEDEPWLIDSLVQLFQDGLNYNTIIIAMARSGRMDLIEEFLRVTHVPAGTIWNTLAKEVFYLMSITNLDRLDREL